MMSQGDEAGVAGGVISGMNMGPMKVSVASTKVFAAGAPVVTQLKTTSHNGTNANAPPGTVVAPSQVVAFASG